ncbi:hypothetical protein HRbin08_01609 [bacterium HR08]|nr:hypothetical protein HRbin08_01609 [bacterium HR08]
MSDVSCPTTLTDARLSAVLQHSSVRRALAWLEAHVEEVTREQIRIC